MNRDHNELRKQLWCDVYVAYVSASNSTSSSGAKNLADQALKCFDERFSDEASREPDPAPAPETPAS